MSVPVVSKRSENVEEQFNQLAAVWQAETGHLSSSSKMVAHPAYQEIIRMGQAVVPHLLRALEREPDHWFSALKAITKADPVPPAERGHIERMAKIWVQWGKENGYRW